MSARSMPERECCQAVLLHNSSARQQALRAADHALLPAPPPFVREVIEVVILCRLEQDVVARLQLVDELEIERPNAVPMLARRDPLEVYLRPVLADLRLE